MKPQLHNGHETNRPTFPTFHDPPYPRLSYGLHFYDSCVKHLTETFKCKNPYIIASNTLSEKTPFLTQLESAINASTHLTLAGTWMGIPPHTPLNSLFPIVEDMRAKSADALITLGGGSLTDGAKLISLLLANPQVTTREAALSLPTARVSDMNKKDPGSEASKFAGVNTPTVPVICIPISLSGGEYSKYAGITDDTTHEKIQFTYPQMYPRLVILDPSIALATPLHTWLSTGVRSIDHCVEGFLSQHATEPTDRAAREALTLLVTGLLRTKADPTDKEARLSSALGSNLSMSLLAAGIPKGASHGIGHQLGPLGVGHGETSCILLPAVCSWNASVNGAKQEQMAQALLDLDPVKQVIRELETSNIVSAAGDEQKPWDLPNLLRAVFNALDMPRCLADVGITDEKTLQKLAQNCLREPYVESNPRPVRGEEDILAILKMVA